MTVSANSYIQWLLHLHFNCIHSTKQTVWQSSFYIVKSLCTRDISVTSGHYRLPVVARQNAIVPRGRLPAYRWLRTTLSLLGWRQRPHCPANQHSAWRQELFSGGPESMEQSSRHTATAWRWTRAVQTTFKDIFVWRGCSALVTLSTFTALCINLLTHSLTNSLQFFQL